MDTFDKAMIHTKCGTATFEDGSDHYCPKCAVWVDLADLSTEGFINKTSGGLPWANYPCTCQLDGIGEACPVHGDVRIKSGRLEIVSRERISEELLKGFEQAQKPEVYFDLLMESGVLPKLIPEFALTNQVIHDSRGAHYGESVRQHLHDVISRLRDYSSLRYLDQGYSNLKWKREIRLAAMLHDIGKVVTVQQIDGKTRFIGHELAGAKIVRERLTALRFSNALVNYIATLITYHMDINDLRGQSEHTVKRNLAKLFISLGEDPIIFDLLDLCEADTKEDLTTMRKILSTFDKPALIRGRDVIQYEPRFRSKILKQMRYLQLYQNLDETYLRKILAGEAHNIVHNN